MVATLVRREDSILRAFTGLAILLEIVVFIEPAPVDALLMLCLAAALMMGKLNFHSLSALPVVALLVFALANLVSMYDPLDPVRAVWYVLVTFYLVASWFFFVGIGGRYGKPALASMINTYCLAGMISAILGIGAYFGVFPFQSRLLLAGRARGLFKDCNVYGPFFVPVVLFALTRIMDARTALREKGPAFAVLVPSALAILLCFSRACWINFVLALAVFLVGQVAFPGLRSQISRLEVRRRIGIGLGVVVIGSIAFLLLEEVPAVSEMMALRVTSSGLQDYDRIRFATQTLALASARSHPLGIGPGQVELVFDYATHSMYLRILSENGVIALFAILAFILSTALRSVRMIEHAEDPWYREINLVVFACIVGHLVNSFFIDTVHWRHIWFIYALPWAPARLRSYGASLARQTARIAFNRRPVFTTPGLTAR